MILRSLSISTRHPRRAFTLIELLIVMGILLILMGLFVLGGSYVTGQLKIRDTKGDLEIAKQLWTNYQSATKLQKPLPSPASTNYTSSAPPASATWMNGQEIAAGSINLDTLQLTNSSRTVTLPQQVIDTEAVMQLLLAIPENQTLFNNLPSNKKVLDAKTQIPLLLDAWGDPILFVPGGGLNGVWVDYAIGSTETVTSEGPIPITQTPSMNAHPFFVSAGPDGDVSNAHGWISPAASGPPNKSMVDDNIYSFQN